MDQVIEPQTGTLDTAEDPNQNGGLPVMSEETIANAIPPDAQRYTFDNGEYVPKLDILYPPETVFFVQHPDGSFTPEGDAGLQTTALGALPQEITLEYMIEKSTEFLRAHGFHVLSPDMAEAAAEKPAPSKIEIGMLLGKLRGLVAGHMTSHGVIDEANGIINKIEAQL